MAYPPAGQPPHIRHWSNPNVIYADGQATGTLQFENNARVLRGRSNGSLDPWGAGRPGFFRVTPAAMTLQAQTVAPGAGGQLHLATAVATATVNIGDGFTVNEGGRFAAIVDPGAFGKQQQPSQPPSTRANCELRVASVRSCNGELAFICEAPERSPMCVRVLTATGRVLFAGSLGDVRPGVSRHSILRSGLARGVYYIIVALGAKTFCLPVVVP